MKITLIVPVRNPQAGLFRAVVALHQSGTVRVVFADDSTTSLASNRMLHKAEALGCTVLRAPQQAKPESAAKRGLLYYLKNTQGHAGAITAGLNMALSAQTLKRCVRCMPRSGQALVLGVRSATAMSPDEALRTTRAQRTLAQSGCIVTDPLSGVCLFSNAMAHACALLPQEGVSWQINLLMAAHQNGIPLHEFPLQEAKKSTEAVQELESRAPIEQKASGMQAKALSVENVLREIQCEACSTQAQDVTQESLVAETALDTATLLVPLTETHQKPEEEPTTEPVSPLSDFPAILDLSELTKQPELQDMSQMSERLASENALEFADMETHTDETTKEDLAEHSLATVSLQEESNFQPGWRKEHDEPMGKVRNFFDSLFVEDDIDANDDTQGFAVISLEDADKEYAPPLQEDLRGNQPKTRASLQKTARLAAAVDIDEQDIPNFSAPRKWGRKQKK